MSPRLSTGRLFEEEVRRTAEAVWRIDAGDCKPEWYRGDESLHELDGVVRLRGAIHVIMATTSTRLEKVKADVDKLKRAALRESKNHKLPVEMWFITLNQLEASHQNHASKNGVRALTLAQFRNRFFNAHEYLAKRKPAAFGSARNLRDESITIPDDEYIELPMTAVRCAAAARYSNEPGEPITLGKIADGVRAGGIFVIVGPFGAGKSLTMRELFLQLRAIYFRELDLYASVPVAISLREHWGAHFGDEILDRHARSIGFTPKEDLTTAWRGGMTYLLLDGFDEMASQTIAHPKDRNFMRSARRESLRGLWDLVSNNPSGCGLAVCGRDHYFDDLSELRSSLALAGREFTLVRLNEFTESQAESYLRKRSVTGALPDWLPRKPLILGYLAHQNLLADVLAIDGREGFGVAWNRFLELVCIREAQHGRGMMDPETIRRVLERLAAMARGTTSGAGPLSGVDLTEAYHAETGDVAGEAVLAQLQRLPGLTPREQDPAARSFVDQDLLAALQGSALARAIAEGSGNTSGRRWLSGLCRDGVRMAAYVLTKDGYEPQTVLAVAKRLSGGVRARDYDDQFAADCLLVAVELSRDETAFDARGLILREVDIPELDLDETTVSGLSVLDSTIGTLTLGAGFQAATLRFERAQIDRVCGVTSKEGLPEGHFFDCRFEHFDDASTNAAVLRLDLPPAMKALLTTLRKLYVQSGGGRKLSALRRGLPSGPVLDSVSSVLGVLESAGVVHSQGEVVHPVRRYTARVHKILASGMLADDPIVREVCGS